MLNTIFICVGEFKILSWLPKIIELLLGSISFTLTTFTKFLTFSGSSIMTSSALLDLKKRFEVSNLSFLQYESSQLSGQRGTDRCLKLVSWITPLNDESSEIVLLFILIVRISNDSTSGIEAIVRLK